MQLWAIMKFEQLLIVLIPYANLAKLLDKVNIDDMI